MRLRLLSPLAAPGRPRVLAACCAAAAVAACDGRPEAARTPAPPACPAADFPSFVAAFAEDTAVQAAHTQFPLEDASFEDGVDERGRDDTGVRVERVARADVRWPIMPSRRRRAADSLALRLDVVGRHPEAVVYKPDTDMQVAYVFMRAGGCWRLVRREDQSL